eukprot:g3703.t1
MRFSTAYLVLRLVYLLLPPSHSPVPSSSRTHFQKLFLKRNESSLRTEHEEGGKGDDQEDTDNGRDENGILSTNTLTFSIVLQILFGRLGSRLFRRFTNYIKVFFNNSRFFNSVVSGLQESLQLTVENRLEQAVDLLAEKVKEKIKDDDMPAFIQDIVDETVETMLPDIKITLFTKTGEYLLSPNRGSTAIPRQRLVERKGKHIIKLPTPPSDHNRIVGSPSLHRRQLMLSPVQAQPPHRAGTRRKRRVRRKLLLSSSSSSSSLVRSSSSASNLKAPLRKQGCCNFSRFAMWCRDVKLTFVTKYQKVRSVILYRVSPYDASIWRNIKYPSWWSFQVIGVTPMGIGACWWFLLFVFRDKSDEYQLVDFIVSFQSMKFLTQGLFGLLRGAYLYYMCVNQLGFIYTSPPCNTTSGLGGLRGGSPSLNLLDAFIFIFQILIVWLAFFLLPYSRQKGRKPEHKRLANVWRKDAAKKAMIKKLHTNMNLHSPLATLHRSRIAPTFSNDTPSLGSNSVISIEEPSETPLDPDDSASFLSPLPQQKRQQRRTNRRENASSLSEKNNNNPLIRFWDEKCHDLRVWLCGPDVLRRAHLARGGHLLRYFWYDTAMVFISIVLILLALSVTSFENWQLLSTLYWIRTFYGLSCVPFVLYKIPIFLRLFTHAHKTGYDRYGQIQPTTKRKKKHA